MTAKYYGNETNQFIWLRRIANELAEANNLKRLELSVRNQGGKIPDGQLDDFYSPDDHNAHDFEPPVNKKDGST